jgi:hypothetical protein
MDLMGCMDGRMASEAWSGMDFGGRNGDDRGVADVALIGRHGGLDWRCF